MLVILSALGIQVTPILTALGVAFSEYALEFTVIVWMSTFVDQYEGQTQVRTRILRRLKAEGESPDEALSPEGRGVASS